MNYKLRQILRFPGRLVSEVIWGFQRATRGYSDRDLWSIDSHIAGILSKSLSRYVEMKNAVSVDYLAEGSDYNSDEEWDKAKALQDTEYAKYSEVFARYSKNGLWHSPESAAELNGVTEEEFDEAMQWLAKRFQTLWY
jgi:hypothetical protein